MLISKLSRELIFRRIFPKQIFSSILHPEELKDFNNKTVLIQKNFVHSIERPLTAQLIKSLEDVKPLRDIELYDDQREFNYKIYREELIPKVKRALWAIFKVCFEEIKLTDEEEKIVGPLLFHAIDPIRTYCIVDQFRCPDCPCKFTTDLYGEMSSLQFITDSLGHICINGRTINSLFEETNSLESAKHKLRSHISEYEEALINGGDSDEDGYFMNWPEDYKESILNLKDIAERLQSKHTWWQAIYNCHFFEPVANYPNDIDKETYKLLMKKVDEARKGTNKRCIVYSYLRDDGKRFTKEFVLDIPDDCDDDSFYSD